MKKQNQKTKCKALRTEDRGPRTKPISFDIDFSLFLFSFRRFYFWNIFRTFVCSSVIRFVETLVFRSCYMFLISCWLCVLAGMPSWKFDHFKFGFLFLFFPCIFVFLHCQIVRFFLHFSIWLLFFTHFHKLDALAGLANQTTNSVCGLYKFLLHTNTVHGARCTLTSLASRLPLILLFRVCFFASFLVHLMFKFF